MDDGYSKATEKYIKVKIKNPDSFEGKMGAEVVKLRVVSVTRDQMLTLRIVGEKGSQKIVQKIPPQAFKIRVISTNE